MIIPRSRLLTVLIVFTLCACEKTRSPEELLIESAQRVAAADLKDPQSAQFRNMIGSEKARMVCGEVNAKNAAGGYVGYRHVMVGGEIDAVTHSFKPGASTLIEPVRPSIGTYHNGRPMTMDQVNQLTSDLMAQQTYKKTLEMLLACQTVVPQMKIIEAQEIHEKKTAWDQFLDHFR